MHPQDQNDDQMQEKLIGTIWNNQKDKSQPLWWCLDMKIKQQFREELVAQITNRLRGKGRK